MPNPNMANREVCDLIFVDYFTKKPFLNLDFANVSTTALTGESVFAYGGREHPKRVQFTGERGGTITIETQIQTVKLWQLITGGEISKSAKFVVRVETTVNDAGTGITLGDTPVAGSVVVYAADDDWGANTGDLSTNGCKYLNIITYVYMWGDGDSGTPKLQIFGDGVSIKDTYVFDTKLNTTIDISKYNKVRAYINYDEREDKDNSWINVGFNEVRLYS